MNKDLAQRESDDYSVLIGESYFMKTDKITVKVNEIKPTSPDDTEDYEVWVTCERIDRNNDRFPLRNYEIKFFLSDAEASEQ